MDVVVRASSIFLVIGLSIRADEINNPVLKTKDIETLIRQLTNVSLMDIKGEISPVELYERQKNCISSLQLAFRDNGTRDAVLQMIGKSTQSISNVSTTAEELCNIFAEGYYSEYYFAQWVQSMERFVSKTVLEDRLVPALQGLNIFLLLIICLTLIRLCRSRSDVAIWYFAGAYCWLGLAQACLLGLPNVIFKVVGWVSNNSTQWSQYTRLENTGATACSTVMFIGRVITFSPNWIIVILLWEQSFRFKRQVKRAPVKTSCGRCCTKPNETDFPVRQSQAADESGEELEDQRGAVRKKKVCAREGFNISMESSILRDGLTNFGARIFVILVLVMELVTNIHSLWLYSYISKRCKIETNKHSQIFGVIYPHFLRVTQATLPHLASIFGSIYLVWLSVGGKRPRCQHHWEMHATDSNGQENSDKLFQASLCFERTEGSAETVTKNPSSAVQQRLTQGLTGPRRNSKGGCLALVIRRTVVTNRKKQGRPQVVSLGGKIGQSPLKDNYTAIGIGLNHLIFIAPRELEWLGYNYLFHEQVTTNEGASKHFEFVKFWNLFEQCLHCWTLLHWMAFLLFMLTTSVAFRSKLRCTCLNRSETTPLMEMRS